MTSVNPGNILDRSESEWYTSEAYIAPEMQNAMQAVVTANGDFSQIAGDSIFPVINMLNTKYFILPLQGGATTPLENPFAQGNAWYVEKVNYVDNANGELDGVGKANLRHEAVADVQFRDILGESVAQDSTAKVSITAYKPNNLTYKAESKNGGVVVFSEIYYPGWTAMVDGQPAELGRVNYILRALKVAPGQHEIVLDFHPKSVATTETVAKIALALLLLTIIGGIVASLRKKNK